MDYGSRDFSLRDPDGHLWAFGTYATGATTGTPSIWPGLCVRDVTASAAWLDRALGFPRGLVVPDEIGAIAHAELALGSNVVMLGPDRPPDHEWADARQVAYLRATDPDAHFATASAAGATVVRKPETSRYGARSYAVRDPEGFLWWVSNYTPAAQPV
jgi:uncharacterized glyoxalase superfamily protein PhnB